MIPEDVIRRVVALYLEGKSLVQCGAAFGRNRSWAWRIIRREVPRGRQKLPRVTAEQRALAVAAYERGATLQAAAAAGGCSLYTCWAHLTKLGLLRDGPMGDVDGQAVAKKFQAGLTPSEIAQQLGINLTQAMDVCYPRPPGERKQKASAGDR